MPTVGGEAAVLASFALGATEEEWSPDGSRLAVIGVEWTAPWAGFDDDERKRHPVRITRAGYRFDDLGWRHDRRSNAYLVSPAGGEPKPLSGDFHDSGVSWRPDGKAVGLLSARHEERYIDGANQAWEIPVAGGDLRALTVPGSWHGLHYRPDGVAHLVGIPDPWDWPAVAGLWRLEAKPSSPSPPTSTAPSPRPRRRLCPPGRSGSAMGPA